MAIVLSTDTKGRWIFCIPVSAFVLFWQKHYAFPLSHFISILVCKVILRLLLKLAPQL